MVTVPAEQLEDIDAKHFTPREQRKKGGNSNTPTTTTATTRKQRTSASAPASTYQLVVACRNVGTGSAPRIFFHDQHAHVIRALHLESDAAAAFHWESQRSSAEKVQA
jgi:hypothetical protein